jgi:putative spermidine/putrescine transport system ATP-binding protein/spermidine/putrescine transport system ATP-binding protein
MVAGLEDPDSGDIVVGGRRINDVPVHRRNFGMVFQDLALFPHKTVYDNIAFGLKYRNVARADIERRVARALEIVRLPDIGKRYPRQLSGGQQQRVAVARAIVIEPDLLLFDEPFSALDANLRDEMRIELKRIQKALGITTVFVTHDQGEALSMADRIVLMRGGKIEQEGSPDQLYCAPRTEFAARFFGTVNEIVGNKSPGPAGSLIVTLPSGAQVTIDRNAISDEPGRLMFRAERATVLVAAPVAEHSTVLPGKIESFDYLGLIVRYIVDIGGTSVTVMQSAGSGTYQPGQDVVVCIPADAWLRF